MELCVALDLPTKEENLALAQELSAFSLWIKIGFRTYIRDGREFIEAIKRINPKFKIFLDLKLYDIPNTMADAAESIIDLDIDMFNVHASAGKIAMQTVMQRVQKYKNPPLVLAVTALTSFDEENFKKIYNQDIASKADEFAQQSYEAGINGVVCSAFESLSIKNKTSEKFLTLTPGIRPFNEDNGDQKRVADIPTAKQQKVDFIVVGRPIYKAQEPKKVVEKILSLL